MALGRFLRQTHRWLSLAFTAAVIVNVAGMFMVDREAPLAIWIGLLALAPLILLMFSGLYLFALPYLVRRDQMMRAGEEASA
jgi:hypothetical protein